MDASNEHRFQHLNDGLADTRAIPFAVGCMTLLMIMLDALNLHQPLQNTTTRTEHDTTITNIVKTYFAGSPKELIRFHGTTIFGFMVARLLGSVILAYLSASTLYDCLTEVVHRGEVLYKCPESLMTLTYIYVSILGLVALLSTRLSKFATRYNILTLLSALTVYGYRDILPLSVIDGHPIDGEEGGFLVFKLVALVITAAIIPLCIPRPYTAVDPEDPMEIPNPEQTASLISLMTFSFMDSTVLLGSKSSHLHADQLAPLADYDAAKYLTNRAFPDLDVYHGAKPPSLFYGLAKVFRKDIAVMVITIIVYSLTSFASPIGMNRILSYLETGGADTKIRVWFWILCLFIGPTFRSLAIQWYTFTVSRGLRRLEAIITQLVFEHSLRIRLKAETSSYSALGNTTVEAPVTAGNNAPQTGSSEQGGSSETQVVDVEQENDLGADDNLIGKINNLITTDLTNIIGADDFILVALYIPLQIILCMVFLYQVLGWSAFIGAVVIVISIPAPGIVASKLENVQVRKMKMTDARVQLVTEVVSILRMVKLFGWEGKMSDRLGTARDEELRWLWKEKMLDQVNDIISSLMPTFTMLATYLIYTIFMKEALTASKIYSTMAVFAILREQIHRLTWQITPIIQGKVSLERVQDFLNDTELLDSHMKLSPATTASEHRTTETSGTDPARTDIGFKDATFTWFEEESTIKALARRSFKLRIDGELIFKRDCINLIIGPTGSGKTSMLMALLGEMHFHPSNADSWFNLPRVDRIAYAAQESWVQNDSIRNNILFRTPYDEERYKKVLKQCALEKDLDLFDAGDETEVGERGITLSGGQKARVTLARAIYSTAKIILLDDIFAALDVHTASWIMNQCFLGELVKGRTVLLVTHNVALASPVASFVVSIGLDGRVVSQGIDLAEALHQNPALATEVEHDKEATEIGLADITTEEVPDKKPSDGKLVLAEEIAVGHVSWRSLRLLLSSMGGTYPFMFFGIVVSSVIIEELTAISQMWFIGYWGSQYETRDPSEVNISFYASIYSALVLVTSALSTATVLIYALGTIRLSRTINKKLIDSILGSTLRWLDETPAARIITRCTQDIRIIDGYIPRTFNYLVQCIIILTSRLFVILYFTPFFIFPGLSFAAIGVYIGNMYLKAQLSMKREMSNARAPLLSHFSAAIHGLVSIRAFGAENSFKEDSLTRINHYTRIARTSSNLNVWFGVRIDVLGSAVCTVLASYLVYVRRTGAGNTGFSLAMAVEFTNYIFYLVRIYNGFEVNSNSLERIQSYLDIEHEPKPTKLGNPPAAWPTSGDLRVHNLSARYSMSGPSVLHGISFHISSGQRIGVVGKTGSGKSSLMLALLRCIITEGTVVYDGVATDSISLEALRSNITIIPQTPELLGGTIRQNLDPFVQNEDSELNDALRVAGLFSLQDEVTDAHLSLDTKISGNGSNLSVGQRQIIALARAMVRRSKLLILDEDYKTDAVIQNTLRNQLSKDITIITIAHRLQTIMDADKIIVLDNGYMVEFDTPAHLLSKNEGHLKAFVDESKDRDHLYSLAGIFQERL